MGAAATQDRGAPSTLVVEHGPSCAGPSAGGGRRGRHVLNEEFLLNQEFSRSAKSNSALAKCDWTAPFRPGRAVRVRILSAAWLIVRRNKYCIEAPAKGAMAIASACL